MSWKLKQIFMSNTNSNNDIMAIVVQEITAYLADEDVCNDDEDMFPRRCEMTGEWYVGEIELWKQNGTILGSVLTRFLGYYPHPSARMPVDDYLGLEVLIIYDPEHETFTFEGGLNSSSI